MKAFCQVFTLFVLIHMLFFVCVFGQADTSLGVVKDSDDDSIGLTLSGAEGSYWTIQMSTDLNNWETVTNAEQVEIGNNGLFTINLALTESPQVFYRAIEDDGIPAAYKLFDEKMEIYIDGDFMVIESDNVPNHPSPYFQTSDSQYEAYNGTNNSYRRNPNDIEEQTFVYRIPINPTEATNKSNTRLGSIGIAINGVAFFNQYAGPNNQPLTNEINSFDQYNGHPQNSGVYHYHFEPIYLSSEHGRGAFLGFLLDGFPVYGPEENGEVLTSDDLDEYHGHFGPTPEYPDGIYHYHFTEDDPYLNGGQYFGTPGTQTN